MLLEPVAGMMRYLTDNINVLATESGHVNREDDPAPQAEVAP